MSSFVVSSVDVEIEAWHIIFLTIFLYPCLFNFIVQYFWCFCNFFFLFVFVEEAWALFDDGAEEILTMHASSILISNEYGIRLRSHSCWDSKSLVVLLIFDYFGATFFFFNLFIGLFILWGTRLGSVFGFILWNSLLINGNSNSYKSNFTCVLFLVYVEFFAICSLNNSTVFNFSSFWDLSKTDLVINLVHFESLAFEFWWNLFWHWVSDNHKESIQDEVHSFAVGVLV